MKEQINIDFDSSEKLSEENFTGLFKSLDEASLNDMLERAGISEESQPEASVQAPEEEPPANEEIVIEKSFDNAEDSGTDIATAVENVTVLESVEGSGLSPEHIGHLLKVLGEDVINDMLKDAGLEDDELLSETSPVTGESDNTGENVSANNSSERKVTSRKGRRLRRFMLFAIFAGIILMVFAVNQISMNVTLNSDDPIQYSEQTDDISALEGSLTVNDVSVSVPTDGSEEYSISYSWAEDDDKYPSVPQAIIAVYPGEAGEKLYTISLYRSETINKKAMPKGKKASNWFDDWEVVSEGDILQKPLNAGSINGFYIYPQINEEGTGTVSDYNDYSYYFAVKERGGVSIYVIEGVCLDENSIPAFYGIMDKCIKSIKINKEEQKTNPQPA